LINSVSLKQMIEVLRNSNLPLEEVGKTSRLYLV
jgi:hypothetical protein